MRKRKMGWILIVAGAVGIIMCIATLIFYGTHRTEYIQTMEVYGGLGLIMFATGIEFLRRAANHINT